MKMAMWNKKYKRGQTLLEIVFILGATVLTLIGLTQAIVLGLRNVDQAKRESLANKIVQQKIESARIYRDQGRFSDWTTDVPTCYSDVTTTSLGTDLCSNTSCSSCSNWNEIGNGFYQQIEIDPEADKKIVTVTVAWGENKSHEVSSKTIISNWKKHE
jgi:Tfp pilus assembly protein PilV